MFEFDAEDGALNAFHAVVVADFVVIIADGGAVFAQGAGAFFKGGIIGQQRPALAAGAEVFAGIKAEAREVAEGAHGFAFVFRAVRLGGVFHHGETVPPGEGEDGIQVKGVAVKVDGQDGLGARGDGAFHEARVEVHGSGLDVHVNGFGSDI